MSNPAKTSKAGRQLIMTAEGLRTTAYVCPAGVLTIGYGHTGDVKPGQKITAAQAEIILANDLARFERAVTSLVKVPLTQNQFDALVSFAFNVGPANLASSTLLKKVNARQYAAAAPEFAKWNKARNAKGVLVPLAGLTTRRAAEARLFLT